MAWMDQNLFQSPSLWAKTSLINAFVIAHPFKQISKSIQFFGVYKCIKLYF